MSYIKQIIDFFFYHNISSEELKERVQHRIVHPLKDTERDEALKNIWDKLGQTLSKDSSWEESFQQLKPSLRAFDTSQGYHPSKFTKRWIRIAAIWGIPFLMFITSGYFYYSISSKNHQSTATDISYSQCYASLGHRKKIYLPDSSQIWLNAGSTLIYPSTFRSSKREVFLLGEGFFDIKKDSLHPFIVHTNYLEMEVLGTTFNVSSYPEDKQIKATLETGKLKVKILHDSTSYYLSPNNQLIYTPSTHQVERKFVKASDYSDWKTGGLFFNNSSFEDVLRILARTYGIKIHIRTSVYKNQKIYVHFNKNESLENIFLILKLMVPELEYKIADQEIFIE